MDGIAATRAVVVAELPTRVLILTTYDLDEYVYQALRAGAAGFMLKMSPPDRLAGAIDLVARGEALLAPSLTQLLITEYVQRPPSGGTPKVLGQLTEREREVLGLIARGLSNEEITASLIVSLATVKTHVNRILTKLGSTAAHRQSSPPTKPVLSGPGTLFSALATNVHRRNRPARRSPSVSTRSASSASTSVPATKVSVPSNLAAKAPARRDRSGQRGP